MPLAEEKHMTETRTIDIDFDVHKLIEGARQNFSESPNTVLRRLLKLPMSRVVQSAKKNGAEGRSWSDEGATLPHGTAVRMRYNRRQYDGEIVDGKWIIGGKTFDTPSGAAGVAVTKGGKKARLDGWLYWEARVPGAAAWTQINALRHKSNSTAEELGL
jgi:hypothetical protein